MLDLTQFDCSVLECGEDSVKRYGDLIPDNLMEGLLRYICQGIKPGSFLCAVLYNDLMTACATADVYSAPAMRHICKFLYNEAPCACHGSKQRVEVYIAEMSKP